MGMDWVSIAMSLPVSHSQRVNCWKCGGKKTASITNRGKHYALNCFKCGDPEVASPPPMTPQERHALAQATAAFIAAEPTLPDDFTTEIPIKGLLWLSKGGLHVDDIKNYGFGWSDRIQRVIMPAYAGHALVAIQARRVDANGDGPKYLGQVWSGPRPVWKSCAIDPMDASLVRMGGPVETDTCTAHRCTLVLTEDILSAARVGKVNAAWSLLGTNLLPAVINQIAASPYTDIVIWMDDDAAGWNARRKMLRSLGAVGIEARIVKSDRDPKKHSLTEIKELIS
jgi:hypothetical protein